MGPKLLRRLPAAAGIVFLALTGYLTLLLYQNMYQWNQSERRLQDFRSSLRTGDDIYARLVEAESSVRSYLISADPALMKTYNRSLAAIEGDMRFYRLLAKDSPRQLQRIDELNALLGKRRKVFSASVLERNRAGAGAAGLRTLTATGSGVTVQIRHTLDEMRAAERGDLIAWELQVQAASAQKNTLLTAFFLILLLALLGSLAAALRMIRRRRLAEEGLTDVKLRLQSVLNSATHLSIIATDLENTITIFSAGAEKMLGYKAEEIIGRTPAAFHVESEIAARAAELSETMQKKVEGLETFVALARGGGFEKREWTYVRKDGSRFPVELTVRPLLDHNGNLEGFLGLATDITTLKHSQLQMRKLSAAIKASPTSIVITDQNANIEYANPKFYELTGYTEQELLGQNPRVISSGKNPKDLYKELWDTILDGRQWEGEFLNRKKSGELFWEHAAISPVRDPHGQITNFVAVKLDITDRKLAAAEMEKARNAAVELARLKSEFLANMSHEIRTPMNAIIGMTGLLLDTQMTEQQRDYVKTVSEAGEALLTIINDILDFSKIESGKILIETMDFDLREVAEGAADLLAQRARAKNLGLLFLIEEGVPGGLRGDPGRLRQVLLNLLGNALKFTESGKVELRISKDSGAGEATALRFSVKDTGIGIPREAQKNLFQVFSQADASTTRKYGGSGLGLSISKRLVELMGGEIGLESEPGKGSTFWFTLPFGKPAAARAPAAAILSGPPTAPPPSPAGPAAINKYFRVLIAEDNIVNQKVAVMQLEKLGYEADVAANGLEVLEAIKRRPYDLVLMDCQMPEMDGFQATAEIRRLQADQRRTPIVAMTANALQGDQEKCLAAGMDGYIPKPVRTEKLAEVLQRWNTVLDPFTLKELRELAGPENPGFLAELAVTYLRDLPERIKNIRAAINSGKAEALRQSAHALKGSSGNIGALRMQKYCLLLEEAGRSGAPQGTAELLSALEEESDLVRAALEALASSSRPPENT